MRIGIDFGATEINLILLDNDDKVEYTYDERNVFSNQPAESVDKIASLARQVKDIFVGTKFTSVGVGIPGMVDFNRGILVGSPRLPNWSNVRFRDMLQEKIELNVVIDNDVNPATLSELIYQRSSREGVIVFLSIGTGVGGGILESGRLLRGKANSAGELGHVTIDYNGDTCWCGGRGCLENSASTSAIINAYKSLVDETVHGDIDGRYIAKRFYEGDANAKAAVDKCVDALGAGIESIACVLGSSNFVLTGGIIESLGDYVITQVRKRISRRHYPTGIAEMNILKSAFGKNAVAVGAAILGQQP